MGFIKQLDGEVLNYSNNLGGSIIDKPVTFLYLKSIG